MLEAKPNKGDTEVTNMHGSALEFAADVLGIINIIYDVIYRESPYNAELFEAALRVYINSDTNNPFCPIEDERNE